MSIRKASQQEFQHQIKDVRSQLLEQVKCLEHRTDVQTSILHEINDFLKKRSEIDLEYSKQLDKLVKSVMLKHKNEKQKRVNWPLHSTCGLWQQLVDDTKEEAKQRGITAEVYGNHVASSITSRTAALQKISKKCREIGVLAQGEIIRVLNELATAMKTYQQCYAEFSVVSSKLQQAEAVKNKSQESASNRKQKSIQKSFNKRSEKFEASKLKCNRARNEYLLCVDAANASLHKFFADDLSDLIDCTDLGMDYWLSLILTNIIAARKAACQTEMNSLANLGSFKDSIQPQLDKQKFFESNNSTFMLPKRFEFRSEPTETIDFISLGDGLSEELKQRHHQINKRLSTLKAESDASWQLLEETEQRIKSILNAVTLVDITEYGIADNRPPADTLEGELAKSYDVYLQNFSFYLFNANLIMRLEARAEGIGGALSKDDGNVPVPNGNLENDDSRETGEDGTEWHDRSRRKKRIGSQTSAATPDTQSSPSAKVRRPRLFGGSLEEYVEATGEKIPLVVISCVRVLSQFGLHHQGIFRVSGSQLEINHIKESFEHGEDPLRHVQDSSDVNSISGVLKLYLRELREPLFPFYLFELLTDCAKCTSTEEFINQITPLLKKLPLPTYLLLRYLFAFLNHLSEFSDENMMDPYNLAICFGPTLLPIPDGKDQVYYQNFVNEVVKNLIVHHDVIFSTKVSGPRYQKYEPMTPNDNSNEIELFVDDPDDYFGSAGGNGSSISGGDPGNNGTFSSDVFDTFEYSSLQQTLNELEFHSSSERPRAYIPTAYSHQQPDVPNIQMVTSNCSAASSTFAGRLPPSVTATLIKSNVVANRDAAATTYCYSSSEENESNTNLAGSIRRKEENGIDTEEGQKLNRIVEAGHSGNDGQFLPKANNVMNELDLKTSQKVNDKSINVGIRNGDGMGLISPASSMGISTARRSSTPVVVDTSDPQYTAIVGKPDRPLRIPLVPPTRPQHSPGSAVSPPNLLLNRTYSERHPGGANFVSHSASNNTATPNPAAPLPSYSALYGNGAADKPTNSAVPTIHLPVVHSTHVSLRNGANTIQSTVRSNPAGRTLSSTRTVLATAAIAQGLYNQDATEKFTAHSPIKATAVSSVPGHQHITKGRNGSSSALYETVNDPKQNTTDTSPPFENPIVASLQSPNRKPTPNASVLLSE
ncbi:rhoGAP domain-containing protein [Ditylenchus destructor]|nr:rhoGAP domain-containing protein [Ditylenchus destructor]